MLRRHSSGVSETHLTISCSKYRPTSFQASRGLHSKSSTNSYSDRFPCFGKYRKPWRSAGPVHRFDRRCQHLVRAIQAPCTEVLLKCCSSKVGTSPCRSPCAHTCRMIRAVNIRSLPDVLVLTRATQPLCSLTDSAQAVFASKHCKFT